MDAAIVSRTLSLIPDRVARTQSGSLFDPNATGGCAHPERVAHLAGFLDWLGPLREVTKDDLRIFGLLTVYGKAAMEASLDDEGDAEIDAPLDAPLDAAVAAPIEETREPALT